MADRLSAIQLEQCTGPSPLTRVRYTLTIDGTDYSSRLLKVNKAKWKLMNRHPMRIGKISIPALSLDIDNTDGVMTVGNASGPWTSEQARQDSIVVVTVTICSPAITVNDFTGSARSLNYTSDGKLKMEVEHPFIMAQERTWKREDQTSDFDTATTIVRDAP